MERELERRRFVRFFSALRFYFADRRRIVTSAHLSPRRSSLLFSTLLRDVLALLRRGFYTGRARKGALKKKVIDLGADASLLRGRRRGERLEKVGRYARDATRGHKRAIFYCYGRRYIGGFDIGRTAEGTGARDLPRSFPLAQRPNERTAEVRAGRPCAVTGRDRFFIFVSGCNYTFQGCHR